MTEQRPPRFVYGRRHSRDPEAPKADYLSDKKLFRRSLARTIGPSEGQPIDSETIWYYGRNASFFRLISNSHTEAIRSAEDAAADGIDGIAIEYVAQGRYHVVTPFGETDHRKGDLGLIQTNIPITARAERVTLSHMFLPRMRLVEESGFDFLAPGYKIRNLNAAPLAPFLAAHLDLLQQLCGQLPEAAFEAALECAASLAIALLRAEVARQPTLPVSDGLSQAMAHMRHRFRDPTLGPDELASELGVSRARLYRAFSGHNLTVMGYLKDLRLRQFVEELREKKHEQISQLARGCGFDMSTSDFARLFRLAYGMTPGEARIAMEAPRRERT